MGSPAERVEPSKPMQPWQWCALVLVAILVIRSEARDTIRSLPGGGYIGAVGFFVAVGCALRMAHDTLLWLLDAAKAKGHWERIVALPEDEAILYARANRILALAQTDRERGPSPSPSYPKPSRPSLQWRIRRAIAQWLRGQ